MALIKCPECGKEISDKAKACIHCGFPLESPKEPVAPPVKQKKFIASYVCNECYYMADFEGQSGNSEKHCPMCGSVMELMEYAQLNENTGLVEKRITPKNVATPNIPKCPTCQSTNISKISKRSKAGDALVFGLFALGKISKQWHCNNCGSEW